FILFIFDPQQEEIQQRKQDNLRNASRPKCYLYVVYSADLDDARILCHLLQTQLIIQAGRLQNHLSAGIDPKPLLRRNVVPMPLEYRSITQMERAGGLHVTIEEFGRIKLLAVAVDQNPRMRVSDSSEQQVASCYAPLRDTFPVPL